MSNIFELANPNWWSTLQATRQAHTSLFTQSPVFDPLEDGKSALQLIDISGSDLSVVNDARTSFNKISTELTAADIKLITYLAKEQHFSPFRGCVLKFKVSASIAISRQWVKHIVASSHMDDQLQFNEKSFRYTELQELDFYVPQTFRSQSKSNRQASGEDLPGSQQLMAEDILTQAQAEAYSAYQQLLKLGVAREQARGILPMDTYTTWTWTCSLQALIHFVKLREGHGAQTEIVKYANVLHQILEATFPATAAAFFVNEI